MDGKKILLVEDDSTTAKVIELQLVKMGYAVVSVAKTGHDAIEKVKSYSPDLLLMDIKLGKGMDGIEAAAAIRQKYHVPVIYLTAYADQDILERAKLTRPLGYVNKPLREKDLRTTITLAFEHIKATNTARNDEFPDIWRIQICCNLENNIINPNPITTNKVKLLGFKSIKHLLPKENHEHVVACLNNRKPQLITGKIRDYTFSWEYTPTSKDDTVRITITDITVNKVLTDANIQPIILMEVLDHLATGIIMVNENLNIFYTNKSAGDLLKNGNVLKDNHGCLNCSHPETTAKLQKYVLDASDHILTIEQDGQEKPLHILISPLKAHKENYGNDLATTILFTFDTLNDPVRIEDLLRTLYGLSPAEAKITAELMQTPSLEQAAKSLGITYNTARTHLKRIFSKTNTNRLSSLIHMVLTGPIGVIKHSGKQ